MGKEKPVFTEVLLKKAGVLSDYEKSQKLYEKYLQMKQRGRPVEKILAELTQSLKSANTSLRRVINVYQKTSDALKAEIDEPMVENAEDHEGYLAKLKEYDAKVVEMGKSINLPFPELHQSSEKTATETKEQAEDATPVLEAKKPSIQEILDESQRRLEKLRKETRDNLTKAGYNEKDLENPSPSLLKYLDTIRKKEDKIRADAREKITDAGYSEKDMAAWVNNQQE